MHMYIHLAIPLPCQRSSDVHVGLQFTFLQDDVGVPLNYRHMEGFGVHTYTLINKDGRVTYVKFHWQPALGALTSLMRYLLPFTQIMTDRIVLLKCLGARSLQPCQLDSVYQPF